MPEPFLHLRHVGRVRQHMRGAVAQSAYTQKPCTSTLIPTMAPSYLTISGYPDSFSPFGSPLSGELAKGCLESELS
jgi:hypothetical protein